MDNFAILHRQYAPSVRVSQKGDEPGSGVAPPWPEGLLRALLRRKRSRRLLRELGRLGRRVRGLAFARCPLELAGAVGPFVAGPRVVVGRQRIEVVGWTGRRIVEQVISQYPCNVIKASEAEPDRSIQMASAPRRGNSSRLS